MLNLISVIQANILSNSQKQIGRGVPPVSIPSICNELYDVDFLRHAFRSSTQRSCGYHQQRWSLLAALLSFHIFLLHWQKISGNYLRSLLCSYVCSIIFLLDYGFLTLCVFNLS